MGNQLCCQQVHTTDTLPQNLKVSHDHVLQQPLTNPVKQIQKYIQIPQISQNIKQKLQQLKPFQQQFTQQQNIKVKQFGNDIYQGPLNELSQPNGIGKMHKPTSSSYFIGHFINGIASGSCYYFMSNGSFYHGNMNNNLAQDQTGEYSSQQLRYFGGFKNNKFHGKGKQNTNRQDYQYDGYYENGKKTNGKMKWIQGNNNMYVYQGTFDQNGQFHGKGSLTDPQGRYEGTFINGMKHGSGIYYYNSKLKYQGYYVNNIKQGQGTLFNYDNTVAYKGLFKNGLPNGKGTAISKNGTVLETEWKDGIDMRAL